MGVTLTPQAISRGLLVEAEGASLRAVEEAVLALVAEALRAEALQVLAEAAIPEVALVMAEMAPATAAVTAE